MVLLEWSERFVLGLPDIDEQHRGLVDAMNEVHALDTARAGKGPVRLAMQKLIGLTARHFAFEEAHMESIDYPDLARHRRVHANLQLKLEQCCADHERGNGDLRLDCYDLLNFWLNSHILGLDRQFVEHGEPARN